MTSKIQQAIIKRSEMTTIQKLREKLLATYKNPDYKKRNQQVIELLALLAEPEEKK